ncbi:MAG: glutathione synthase [Pseudomonadota bacterium]
MSLAVAVQMDPITSIDITGDTTFALMLEAAQRGHTLFVYGPEKLSIANGAITVRGEPVMALRDDIGRHADMGETETRSLSDFDVVLMRQDPPFDMAYITATHILERAHPEVLVVNDPSHVRNAPEKIFVLDFVDLMPPTLVTRDRTAIEAFRTEHRDIIVKPLYGNGGAGVFRLRADDQNLYSLLEMFEAATREPVMVQAYLPAVRAGDKRIILIEGEAVGAINRIPAENEARSNMHVGGKAVATELTAREREICDRLGPALRERGMTLVGIDVIGDYLTEINVTSPTGIREVKRFGGPDIAALFWDAVERRRGAD